MALFYVDNIIDIDDGDLTPGNVSLREAIGLANASVGPDTIKFASAITGSTINLNGTELVITDSVTIDGDTTGDDVADITIGGSSASRVFNITGGTSTLDALTITQAANNEAVQVSAGAYVTVTNSSITGNGLDGITNAGDLTVTNSTISGNGQRGIYNSGTANVTNSTVSGNTGIGISTSSDFTLTKSTVADNSGGGIAAFGATAILTITSSTISGNTGGSSGGGLRIISDATATVTSSTISGNTAFSRGGGIYNSGNTTLTNTTLSGNAAGITGGGIHNSSFSTAVLVLYNSTVTDNIVTDHSLNTTTIANSIVTGGLSLSGTGTYNGVNIFSQLGAGDAQDIIETNLNNIFASVSANPYNGANNGVLGDYGGDVQTIAILQGGVAHDAASGGVGSFDARGVGFARSVGLFVDIGAFEFDAANNPVSSATFVVDTLSDVDDGNFSAGNLSLREALRLARETGGDDVIEFSAGISGGTITLAGSELSVASDVVIDGDINNDGIADITVDGNGTSRVFNISHGESTLYGLNVTGGYFNVGFTGGGGGILIGQLANTTLDHVTVTGNSTADNSRGGGVYNLGGTALITDSTISNNTTATIGGGISSSGATTLVNTTVSDNTATQAGAGIYHRNDQLTVVNSTISDNTGGFFWRRWRSDR